jgi:hypothetical protein
VHGSVSLPKKNGGASCFYTKRSVKFHTGMQMDHALSSYKRLLNKKNVEDKYGVTARQLPPHADLHHVRVPGQVEFFF